MRCLFTRCLYPITFAKLQVPRMSVQLKNQLFQLTEEQNTQLQALWKNKQNQNQNEMRKFHQQIVSALPKFESLTALKSVALYYMQNGCNDEYFWSQLELRSHQLLQIGSPDKFEQYLFPLAYVFGSIKRKQLINKKEVIQQYQECSSLLISKITVGISEQTPQNISHIISLIHQYEIDTEASKEIIRQLLIKSDYSKYNIKDIIYLLWVLRITSNRDFLQIGLRILEEEGVTQIIQKEFSSLDQNLCSRLLISIAQFKFRNAECIALIADQMPIFHLKQLVTLIAIFIKNPLNLLSCQFPILLSLKTQFNEYFETEDKDPNITLDGIRFLTHVPSQVTREQRTLLIDKLSDYGKFILYNIDHFSGSALIDLISMANYFTEYEQIINKLKQIMTPFKMNLEDSIYFLMNIQKEATNFVPQINECLTQMITIHQKEIPKLDEEKHLQFLLSLSLLEDNLDDYPQVKELLAFKDESKIQMKLLQTQEKTKKDQLLQDQSFKSHFKFFNGFMENNFEFNLFLCEKLGVFQYARECRINLNLLDYRLYNVEKQKFNLTELKKMQCDSKLLEEFFRMRYDKYDDISVDRFEDENSLFIEIDGINHFDLNRRLTHIAECKKTLLKKYKLKLHTISLDSEIEIKNSIKVIEDILNK